MKKLGLELKSNISKINFFPGFKIQDLMKILQMYTNYKFM